MEYNPSYVEIEPGPGVTYCDAGGAEADGCAVATVRGPGALASLLALVGATALARGRRGRRR